MLPLLAVAALAVQVPIAWAGSSIAGLAGIAVGLAITTTGILVVLLARARRARRDRSAASRAARSSAARPPRPCSEPRRSSCSALPAAVIGLVVYAAVLGLWRPAGLRSSWVYLRGLQ